MTMTDLGVECVVGLCMAAAIWWVARRRRTHTEEPKTRFESLEPAKAMALVDDATAADAAQDALLPEGDTSERDEAYDDTTDEHHQQQGRDSFAEEDEEDEAAETDVTDHDVEEEEEEEEDDNEQIEEGEERQDEEEEEEEDEVMDDAMKEAMARAEAMAAKMGVNMTESFMAMEEFLVLDTPPPAMAQSSFEEERMRMEDPASFVHLEAHEEGEEVKGVQAEELDDQAEEEEEEVERVEDNEAEAEAEAEAEEEEEEVKEKEEAPAAGPSLMSAFWAQCEYKDECNLCNMPFSFLVRRHHCRMCRASVCGGCSSNSAALAEFGGSVERVCDRCWASMQMAAADPHHAEDEEDGDDAEEEEEEEKALSS